MTTATSPGINGTTHKRNGEEPASRLAADVPPLEAVSTVDGKDAKPNPAGDKQPGGEGRTAKGTFAKGNAFARGNPNARHMAELRSALLRALDEDQLARLGELLYDKAMTGDWAAAKLLLAYAIGKPADAPDADRLDLDEWKLLDASPTRPQVLRALVDGSDPAEAAALIMAAMKTVGDFVAHVMTVGGEKGRRISDEMEARVGK